MIGTEPQMRRHQHSCRLPPPTWLPYCSLPGSKRVDTRDRVFARSTDSDQLTGELQQMIQQLASLGYQAAAEDAPERPGSIPAKTSDEILATGFLEMTVRQPRPWRTGNS